VNDSRVVDAGADVDAAPDVQKDEGVLEAFVEFGVTQVDVLQEHAQMHAGVRDLRDEDAAHDLPAPVLGVETREHREHAHAVVQQAERVQEVGQVQARQVVHEVAARVYQSQRFEHVAFLAVTDA